MAVISARYPVAGAKGDQLRVFAQVRVLAKAHTVRVLTAEAPSGPEARRELEALAEVRSFAASRISRALGAVNALARGRPAQVGWMMPRHSWRRILGGIEGCDVVLVSTVRSIRGPVGAPLVVDHEDALSLKLSERAAGSVNPAIRAAAMFESRLTRGWEREVALWAKAQVVTSGRDAAQLPSSPPPLVLPQAWDGGVYTDFSREQRDIDLVFSGNMAYPPNRDAAEWLAGEILPLVRTEWPEVEAVIVGRDAAALGRLPQVTVLSDVPDVLAVLRRAKLAAAPLRIGSGSPNKVLEAAASGAAVVATPRAVEPFGMPAATAESAESFARAVVRLLSNEEDRRTLAKAASEAVKEMSWECRGRDLERVLSEAAGR
ncbi:MAG TPA: glycosyltransferase family 4 protein [Thermoleophilaceae bacterium]|nr:glycosyltransferase family 4 protein [Thermoleophilaceae bacterium]